MWLISDRRCISGDETGEECRTGGCEGGTVFDLLGVAFCRRSRDEGWSDDRKVRVKRKRWKWKMMTMMTTGAPTWPFRACLRRTPYKAIMKREEKKLEAGSTHPAWGCHDQCNVRGNVTAAVGSTLTIQMNRTPSPERRTLCAGLSLALQLVINILVHWCTYPSLGIRNNSLSNLTTWLSW